MNRFRIVTALFAILLLALPTSAQSAKRFEEIGLVQTTDYAMGLALRTVEGERQLVVSDHAGGIRVFGD